ncbi:g4696 [Coccomyxa viridis]|uniref:G4696 protein n=1 Tax=Coccomyxa viridis TaxID=1274662 RepID=A0ABP1FUX5_9CHLO
MALKQPAVFVAHGGGPSPLLSDPSHQGLTSWLQHFPSLLKSDPKAIMVISAHWEERQPTLTSGAAPPLIYDYYGFPPEAYKITYPAPGYPELAEYAADLLRKAGFHPALTDTRGFDHGTFVPLKLAFPAATIPVLQLSLLASMDAKEHIRMGQAVGPLRDEGVLLFGSGLSYHSMPGFSRNGGISHASAASKEFDGFLQDVVANPEFSPDQRLQLLEDWEKGPSARECQPREDHLLPLHVIAGAAGGEAGRITYDEELMGVKVSSFQFD